MNWKQWLAQWDFADEIALPEQVGAQAWEPTPKDRAAAWDFYTEVRTRITSQPLHYLTGDEQTALESVATLFKQGREVIHKYGPEARHFATIAVFTLNRTVRPFTAKWHKAVTDGRLQNEDVRHQLREEMISLQKKLRRFCTVLGALAEGDGFIPGSESWPTDAASKQFPLGEAIPFQIVFDRNVPDDQQQAIRWCEHNEIRRRRGLEELAAPAASSSAELPSGDERLTDVAGLAISGGGLRSATFALGVVQGLAEKRMLGQFDYLSTVSGGGYLGSFLSSYLDSPRGDVGADGQKQLPFQKPAVGESAALRHLRAHSKFLLTGGLTGRLVMVLQAAYGFLANMVIVLAWLLVGVLFVDCLDWWDVVPRSQSLKEFAAAPSVDTGQYWREQRWLGIPWLVVAGLLLVMPLVLRLFRGGHRAWRVMAYQRMTAIISVLAMLATLIVCLPFLFHWEHHLWQQYPTLAFGNWTWLAGLAVLQRLGVVLSWIKTSSRTVKLLIDVLLFISGPLFVFVLFMTLAHWLLIDWQPALNITGETAADRHYTLMLITSAFLAYSHLLLDINQSSLHPFYRDRLSRAYIAQAAGEPGDQLDALESLGRKPLTALRQNNPTVPYHLINTALNSPAGRHPSLRGRKSDIFIFSRWFSGCSSTGYFETAKLERLDPHLDLATAMAISGAAASPFMGTKKTPASLLFAVLNIRLDYWLPLPERRRIPILGRMPGPAYLFRQVLGNVHERTAFVNLSDGGHIENLGLYELLRRRCKFIVAIDGECDPDITCSSLVNLQRFVRTDFGIELDLDLTRVQKAEDGTVPFHFLLATINYPDLEKRPDTLDESTEKLEEDTQDAEPLVGYLLYLKSSLTGNESPPIARYRAESPEFSHESTADLFYDEAQFEAYRSLGHHIAMELFRRELIGGAKIRNIHAWFSRLVTQLHEPAAQ